MFGGQPGSRRARFQQYYDDTQEDGQDPVQVPEAMPEQPSPVAQAIFPAAQQARQRVAPTAPSYKPEQDFNEGPIEQLYNPANRSTIGIAQMGQQLGESLGPAQQFDVPQSSRQGKPVESRPGGPDDGPLADVWQPPPLRGTPIRRTPQPPAPTTPPVTPPVTPPGQGQRTPAAGQPIPPGGLPVPGPQGQPTTPVSGQPPTGEQPPAGGGQGPGGGGPQAWRGFTNQGGQWGGGQYNPDAIQTGDYVGQLEGFNTAKLDPAHEDTNTLKYVFARAASGVDVKQPGATQAVVDRLRAMGVNASVENADGEADRIIFHDTGESIDVMRGGANVGQEGWQWIDAQYGGADPNAAGAGGPGGAPQVAYDPANPIHAALVGQGYEPGTLYWDMLMAQLAEGAKKKARPSGDTLVPPGGGPGPTDSFPPQAY